MIIPSNHSCEISSMFHVTHSVFLQIVSPKYFIPCHYTHTTVINVHCPFKIKHSQPAIPLVDLSLFPVMKTDNVQNTLTSCSNSLALPNQKSIPGKQPQLFTIQLFLPPYLMAKYSPMKRLAILLLVLACFQTILTIFSYFLKIYKEYYQSLERTKSNQIMTRIKVNTVW